MQHVLIKSIFTLKAQKLFYRYENDEVCPIFTDYLQVT